MEGKKINYFGESPFFQNHGPEKSAHISGEDKLQNFLSSLFVRYVLKEKNGKLQDSIQFFNEQIKSVGDLELLIYPSKNPALLAFRRELVADCSGSLMSLLENNSLFGKLIFSKFRSLDQIEADKNLAEVLGTNQSKQDIIGELISRRIITENFPGVSDYLKLLTIRDLRTRLKSLREENGIEPNPFSGFGKCFENWVSILCSLQNLRLEYQVKMSSHSGKAEFRVADLVSLGGDLQTIEEIIEIKSSPRLSRSDYFQLQDYLVHNKRLTYVILDESAPIYNQIKKNSANIKIISSAALENNCGLHKGFMHDLFSSRESFKIFNQEGGSSQILERRLFSIFLGIKAGLIHRENISPLLSLSIDTANGHFEEIISQFGLEITPRKYGILQASYYENGERREAWDEIIRRLNKRIAREKSKKNRQKVV